MMARFAQCMVALDFVFTRSQTIFCDCSDPHATLPVLYLALRVKLVDRNEVKPKVLITSLLQTAFAGSAIVMSSWVKMPRPAVLGMGLLGADAIAAALRPAGLEQWFEKWGAAVALGSTILLLTGLLPGHQVFSTGYLDFYYAVVCWLLAVTLLPLCGGRRAKPHAAKWKLLAVAWAWLGWVLWIATAYIHNERAPFYIGLVMGCFLVIAWMLWFRLPGVAITAANTLLLLFVGLPLTDLFLHSGYALPPQPGSLQNYRRYYSYHAAKRDRAAFEVWWNYFFFDQYLGLEKQVKMKDPGPLRFRLRPNSHGMLVRSPISINSQGFRGKEIPKNKGNAYRIVTLGESTTFGFTIDPDDKPWPELLEQMIRDRLHPARPVEVINAGIPGADQLYSLRRLESDILPLKPDMLICYHGINGFPLLEQGKVPPQGRPPFYQPRPLQLLADCEYRFKLRRYGRRLASPLLTQPSGLTNLIETPCARIYEQLIRAAETNRIRFVLANFSMAVNAQSDAEIVEFFRPRFPSVCHNIKSNEALSQLVAQLAREHPEVCFVDTHPGLDGVEEKFLDLVHFCHDGDQQLAENFFAGIRKVLEQDLAQAGPATPNR